MVIISEKEMYKIKLFKQALLKFKTSVSLLIKSVKKIVNFPKNSKQKTFFFKNFYFIFNILTLLIKIQLKYQVIIYNYLCKISNIFR